MADSTPGYPSAPQIEGDLALWRDLLRRAGGDEQLASRWMSEIGASTPKARETDIQKDFDLAAAECGAPATFFCPISFRVFRDPVMLPTGQTYERRYLDRWLAHGNLMCPATGQPLTNPVTIVPNVALRKSIEEWAATYTPWILEKDGHLKPIAEGDDFAAKARPVSMADDLALAISLQEDELEHHAAASAQQTPTSRGMRRRHNGGQPCFSLLNCILYAITAGCTTVFILALWKNGWEIENLSVNPLVGPSALALSRMGSKVSSNILDQCQWWRLVTCLFLSSGVIHLFSAITSLWTFAKYLERVLVLPWLSVSALFLVPGLAGVVVSANLAFGLDAAGATAGVCGLLGAVWMEQVVNWQAYRRQWATFIVLFTITAMFIVLGLLPLVDNWLHVAALVCGALMCPAFLLVKQGRQGADGWTVLKWLLKLAGLAIVAGVLVLGFLSFYLDYAHTAQECGWCTKVACVNTTWWSCQPVEPLQAQASCQFGPNVNATTAITCPSGSIRTVATNSISDRITACNSACSTQTVYAPPAGAPIGGVGVLI